MRHGVDTNDAAEREVLSVRGSQQWWLHEVGARGAREFNCTRRLLNKDKFMLLAQEDVC